METVVEHLRLFVFYRQILGFYKLAHGSYRMTHMQLMHAKPSR
jgi:hypothetical protein